MSGTLTRRQTLATLGAAAATTVLPGRLRAQSDTIKIGFLAPLSGSQEVIGQAQLLGAQIAVDQINAEGGVMGRTLELLVRDDGSKPDKGVAVTRELVGSGVNILCGSFSSPVVLAIVATLAEQNALFVSQASSANSLTYEAFVPNFFRATEFTAMRQRNFARLSAQVAPDIQTYTGMLAEITTSYQSWDTFRDGCLQFYPEIAGHEIAFEKEVRAPFGSPDFRNFIAQIMRSRAEGLFLQIYGGDAITLMKQQKAYGMMEKFKFVIDPGSEYFIPQTLGRDTPPGLWTGHHWYPGAYEGHKVNDDLFAEYQKRTGGDKYPQGYTGEAHSTIRAIASGIQRAQSTQTEDLIAAMEGMTFDTCKGERTFRPEDHQADADVNYIQFMPDDSEQGWHVSDYVVIKGADAIPPANPGGPYALDYLGKSGLNPTE